MRTARIMIQSGTLWLPSALIHCMAVATWGAGQERSLKSREFLPPYAWFPLATGPRPTFRLPSWANRILIFKIQIPKMCIIVSDFWAFTPASSLSPENIPFLTG